MSRRWRLYLFGGSFNPPGLHHEHVVQGLQTLCEGDDLIVIVPCGVRPDKGRTNDVDSTHRAAMVALTRDLPFDPPGAGAQAGLVKPEAAGDT